MLYILLMLYSYSTTPDCYAHSRCYQSFPLHFEALSSRFKNDFNCFPTVWRLFEAISLHQCWWNYPSFRSPSHSINIPANQVFSQNFHLQFHNLNQQSNQLSFKDWNFPSILSENLKKQGKPRQFFPRNCHLHKTSFWS